MGCTCVIDLNINVVRDTGLLDILGKYTIIRLASRTEDLEFYLLYLQCYED
jgi:hypothetical protein